MSLRILLLFVVICVTQSSGIRSKLLTQILTDYPDLRDCLKSENDLTLEEIDLNRDGKPEYNIQLPSTCDCGEHNCTIYIYRRSGQGFELIIEGALGYGVEFLNTSTNGYADLRINAHDSAAKESRTIYKFDGKEYREARTTIVNLETGESKPAYRRVQFKRGASSTTVQGNVSTTLPDTYLVGARAGQVMTVQLTSASKSVQFMVTSKTTMILTDDKRSWTGTLPETGDYHIIVDADEGGGAYSMTISIK